MDGTENVANRANPKSPNVPLSYAYWAISGCARGLQSGPAMIAYIYFVCGISTIHVGIIEAVNGIARILVGLPGGFFADKYRRQSTLRAASLLMTVAIGATAATMMIDYHRFVMLCVSFGLWGSTNGLAYGALEAIFADSVATGTRSHAYAIKWQCNVASAGLGPAIAVLLFYKVGNAWRLWEMRTVVLVGLGISVMAAVLLLFFRDSWTLHHASEAHHDDSGTAQRREASAALHEKAPLLNNTSTVHARDTSIPGPHTSRDGCVNPQVESINDTTSKPAGQEWMASRSIMIPTLMAVGDIISGLASGMTIKFFPIFFLEKVGLSPMAVNGIWAVAPLGTAAFVSIARRASIRMGRIQLYILFKVLGVSLLLVLALDTELWGRTFVIVPVYAVRTALMNSPKFLLKGILMDHVHKRNRAKWSAVDLVTGVGWSGSAAAGGALIHAYGWKTTFLCTAILQATAILPCIGLLYLVPRREQPK
eukprot:m.33867 g.33867  ORF g.33867 m.33867 type:complete len:480 (-) comp14265_c0_seq1:77-1516(-)